MPPCDLWWGCEVAAYRRIAGWVDSTCSHPNERPISVVRGPADRTTRTGPGAYKQHDLCRQRRIDESCRPSSCSSRLRPSLQDFGIRVERVAGTYRRACRRADSIRIAWEYCSCHDRAAAVSTAARTGDLGGHRRRAASRSSHLPRQFHSTCRWQGPTRAIPYSLADGPGQSSAARSADGRRRHGRYRPLADDEIAINQWVADELSANVGDTIQLDYFLPETTHGDPTEVERSAETGGHCPFGTAGDALSAESRRAIHAASEHARTTPT